MYKAYFRIFIFVCAALAAPLFRHEEYNLLLGLELDPPTSPNGHNLAPQLLHVIAELAHDITNLDDTLNTIHAATIFDSSAIIAVQMETKLIGSHIRKAILVATSSSAWSSIDSYNIATGISTIHPQLLTLLANIVDHRSVFPLDLAQKLKASLKEQLRLTRTLGEALGTKLDLPFSTFGKLIIDQMLDHMETAITNFNVCMDLSCSQGSIILQAEQMTLGSRNP